MGWKETKVEDAFSPACDGAEDVSRLCGGVDPAFSTLWWCWVKSKNGAGAKKYVRYSSWLHVRADAAAAPCQFFHRGAEPGS